jgi:adenosylcobinamide kinase / adenosylcobinamide-phosphate guanylyltransferase
MSPVRILVTGGVRSGKSRHAEQLVVSLRAAAAGACYVAAGPSPDAEQDPDWTARVVAHRARRPSSWTTEETLDLAGVLARADRPLLVDCLGTWLTGVVDAAAAWDTSSADLSALLDESLSHLLPALRSCTHDVVLVTNEVGLGVVPEHRSGRVFRDLLGTLNQRVGEACDEVHLVVAGRVLRL